MYKGTLDEHMVKHTNIAAFACNICGKTYKHRKGLSNHKKIHEPAKHVCEKCGRKFFRKEYLLEHIKTHRDKEQCSSCKAVVFLDKHVCKKDRKPQFPCDVCGKLFRRRRYLQEHIRCLHMRAESYNCTKCDKTFSFRSGLYNHYKKYCGLQNWNNHDMKTSPLGITTHEAANTTLIDEFANTADPNEATSHNEPSHLDLQCLPSSL